MRQTFGHVGCIVFSPPEASSAANPYIRQNVSLRPPAEVKRALLTTLKKVEESVGSEADNPDVAELKHIVVQRIANLEEAEQAEPTPDSPLTAPDEVA